MSFKSLSKSLVDACTEVFSERTTSHENMSAYYMAEGLKKFGVKRETQLSEEDRIALHSWVQTVIAEACSCGDYSEPHMPGDDILYTDSGEMKKDLGEEEEDEDTAISEILEGEDSEEETLEEEMTASDVVKAELEKMGKSLDELTPEEKKELFNKVDDLITAKNEYYAKNLKEVLDLTSGTEQEAIKRAIDDFLKSDAPQFKGKTKEEKIDMAVAAVKSARDTARKEERESIEEMRTPYVVIDTADGNKVVAKASNERDAKSSILHSEKPPMGIKNKKTLKIVKTSKKQDIGFPLNEEVESEDVATNGAVAVGNAMLADPVNADVIKDSVPTDGAFEYRLLLQYATGGDIFLGAPYEGTHIYPPLSLPGAKSIEDLKSLVEDMPFYNSVVERTLEKSMSETPHSEETEDSE